MKELINFYYGMFINNINHINDNYYFDYNGDKYYLIPFNQSEKNLERDIEISNILTKYHIDSHYIINNNNGKKITSIDDVNYVLLKIINNNEEYSIIEINKIQQLVLKEGIVADKNYYNWSYLWQIKIDNLENALIDLKIDKIIQQSIDYYLGISEIAISYYNQINSLYNLKNYPLTWCHRRIFYPNMTINYFNPLNYLFDYNVRDIAEYLKSSFFCDQDNAYQELDSFLHINKIDNISANLLFARLLFPTYYFDVFEKWINNKSSSNDLIVFVKKQKEYESFLKKAYQMLSKYALMISIDYFKL